MKNGCRARRHMAVPRTDPYEEIETQAKASYDQQESELDKEINERLKPDWSRQFTVTAKEQIRAIELQLAAQRDVVARYDNIKFH